MKNVMKLGKTLSKKEQKSINGGNPSLCDLPDCVREGAACCTDIVGFTGTCTSDGVGGFDCIV